MLNGEVCTKGCRKPSGMQCSRHTLSGFDVNGYSDAIIALSEPSTDILCIQTDLDRCRRKQRLDTLVSLGVIRSSNTIRVIFLL